MALTMSEIQALTDDVWMPGAQDNWSRGNVLLFKALEKAETRGSAEKVRMVLEYQEGRGGAMGATTVFNTAKKEIMNAARYPWAKFWAGCTYDIDDKMKISGGDAGIDYVLKLLDSAQKTIRNNMGNSLHAAHATSLALYGAETTPFYGIPDLMSQTSGTAYGGIAEDDMSVWAAFSNGDVRVMNFATMQYLRRNCATGNDTDNKPDLYLTTETLKDAFENSLQAAQRHSNPELVKAGFDNIEFGGVPVVADDKCASGYVHGFNWPYLYMIVHEDFNFTHPKWQRPTNQEVYTTQIIWGGSFGTSQRRAQGRLTGVTA